MSAARILRFVALGAALFAAGANAATLSESPANTSPAAIVTATWGGVSTPTANDWIGLFTPGSPNTAFHTWRYTTGAASGSLPFTLTAVPFGTYELRILANNSYTLLATSSTFTIGPAVSGTVTFGGSPLAGVALGAPGGTCGATNASGQYSCAVPSGWTGSVTPASASHTFTPASRSYTGVASNQSAQTYTAVTSVPVSGTVTLGGSPLAGVALAVPGGTCSASNASGQYACSAPPGFTGSITPSLAGYMFAPGSRSYSALASPQSGEDYAATALFQISGTVAVNGVGLSNVALAATGGVTCTSTNASGQYSCSAPQGWSGSVTPSATGYSFSPASRSYTSLAGPSSAQAFAAAIDPSAETMYFIHVDHLNTARLITNAAGVAVWRHDNAEPFGNTPPDENPSGLGAFEFPLTLSQYYRDRETGSAYAGRRDAYDPQIGRFPQSDPIGLQGGTNTYAYVGGSPLGFVDPTGLLRCQWVGPVLRCQFGPTPGGSSIPGEPELESALKNPTGVGSSLSSSASTPTSCPIDRDKQCEYMYYQVDIPVCRNIKKRRGAAAAERCYASAAQRYAACLRGDPIPPLDTWNN